MSKVFISELAEFMGNNTTNSVSDMMGITGVITIGCSYLGYRFAGGKIPSDD